MLKLNLLLPEIVLASAGLLLMMADVFVKGRNGKVLYHMAILAAAVTMGLLGLSYSFPGAYQGVGTLWAVDPMALFFKVLILATVVLVLFLAVDYDPPAAHGHLGSFSALVLLAGTGMMLLVSAVDLLLIFLALELVSIASFVLVGYERKDLKSSEGAIKYFLIGAFSSGIMVYGISLFYGAVGTTRLAAAGVALAQGPTPLLVMACLMLIVGFGFKVSMAPFHFWVPDAYEGAPTPITTMLSVAPKVAGFAVLLRVFTHFLPHAGLELTNLFIALSMLTMSLGNLTALFQKNVKRLLAYSSIAQAGYLMIGFVTGDVLGREGLLLYSLAYLLMNVGAFAVVIVVGNEDGYELEAYDGLGKRNLGLALLMCFFLLSLAGIPPLAGFVGKFYLFAAAIKGGFYWLAVVAVLNSVVSVYYYMRITHHMFFQEPRSERPLPVGLFVASGIAVAAVGVFVVGIYPEPFIASVRLSAEMLPSTSGFLAALP